MTLHSTSKGCLFICAAAVAWGIFTMATTSAYEVAARSLAVGAVVAGLALGIVAMAVFIRTKARSN